MRIYCKNCKYYYRYPYDFLLPPIPPSSLVGSRIKNKSSDICLLNNEIKESPIIGKKSYIRTEEKFSAAVKNKDFNCKDFNPKFIYKILRWLKIKK